MGRQERAEQRRVATALRAEGRTWVEIATTLRARWPELNGRAAMRVAHGWNQSEAAEAWNRLWPDRPKTDKDIGLWELRRPGFATLDRLGTPASSTRSRCASARHHAAKEPASSRIGET